MITGDGKREKKKNSLINEVIKLMESFEEYIYFFFHSEIIFGIEVL